MYPARIGQNMVTPSRHSIRLKDYDYTQSGAYYVTLCTEYRICLFGKIVEAEVELSSFGKVVHNCWEGLPNHYGNVELDVFVIMPNHIHGVIVLNNDNPIQGNSKDKLHGLSEIIRGFKTFSAREINQLRNTSGKTIWQRGYYDHIIRNEKSVGKIREYIENNPLKWAFDRDNPNSNPGGL